MARKEAAHSTTAMRGEMGEIFLGGGVRVVQGEERVFTVGSGCSNGWLCPVERPQSGMPPRPQGRIKILIVLLDGRRVVLEQVGVYAPAHRHRLPIVLPPAPLCHEIQLAGYTSHINVSSPEPCKRNVSVQGQACTLTKHTCPSPQSNPSCHWWALPRQAQGIQSESLAIKTGGGKPPPRRPFPDLLDMRDAPLCAMSQALVPARA
jgi:hypothetical protein